MKKTFKKVLAVILSLAMIVTSVTVYNITTKAEGEGIADVTITASADDKNGINANWTNPEGVSYLKSYIYAAADAENVSSDTVTDEHSAKNGTANWIWNDQANVTQDNVDNVVASKDGSISTKEGGEFIIAVVFYNADGEVIAFGKSDAVTVEVYTNYNLQAKFDRYENTTLAFVSWQLVTGATSYKAFYGDTQVGTTQGESGTWTSFIAPVTEQTYDIVVNAYNATDEVVATSTINMPATEAPTTEAPTTEGETEGNPAEDYDTSSITEWTAIPVDADTGIVDEFYIETAKYNEYINAVIFKISLSWQTSPYPGDFGGVCSLVGADFATAVRNQPLTAIWVDGTRYAKDTPQFDTVGDQCHIAASLFELPEGVDEKIFVVSTVGTSVNTYAIKVVKGEALAGVEDGTNVVADAEWKTNPEAEGWVERAAGNGDSFAVASAITANWYSTMVYGSAVLEQGKTYNVSFDVVSKDIKQFNMFENSNGDKFLLSSDGVTWTETTDGKYTCHVDGSFTWNDATVKAQLSFGFGYFNGTTANVTTADTIAVADGIDVAVSNLEIVVPTGEDVTTEAPTGEETTTEAPVEETTTEAPATEPIEVIGQGIIAQDGAKVTFVWGQNAEQMELGQTYNVYIDGEFYQSYAGATAVDYEFATAGDHTIVIKAALNGKETEGVTLNVTVEGEAPTEAETTTEAPVEETTTETPVAEPIEVIGQGIIAQDGAKITFVWGQNAEQMELGQTYNVYIDGEFYQSYGGATAVDYEFATAGEHTIVIKAELNGKETEGVTLNVMVEETTTVATYTVTVDGEDFATVEEGGTVTLPSDANVGYYVDGKLYKAGSTYTVTADVDFAAVNIAATNGASIRFAVPTGIRFQANITSNNKAVFDNAIQGEGMLIAPKDIYDANGGILDITSDYTKINVTNNGWYLNTPGSYCASLVNINEYNYVRSFVARAYVTVEYADGSVETVYSGTTDDKSIKGVASALKLSDAYSTLTAEYQAMVDTFAAAE